MTLFILLKGLIPKTLIYPPRRNDWDVLRNPHRPKPYLTLISRQLHYLLPEINVI
jgi:hypothetical protein